MSPQLNLSPKELETAVQILIKDYLEHQSSTLDTVMGIIILLGFPCITQVCMGTNKYGDKIWADKDPIDKLYEEFQKDHRLYGQIDDEYTANHKQWEELLETKYPGIHSLSYPEVDEARLIYTTDSEIPPNIKILLYGLIALASETEGQNIVPEFNLRCTDWYEEGTQFMITFHYSYGS